MKYKKYKIIILLILAFLLIYNFSDIKDGFIEGYYSR